MPIATFMQGEMARNSASSAEQERLRKELAEVFVDNQVDVYVQTDKELIDLWISRLEARGIPAATIAERFEEITGHALELTRDSFHVGKAHGATGVNLVIDSKVFVALANDMRRSGNLMGAYHIAVRNGQRYIIFKGYPGLRKLITGTRYKVNSPKILKMGIGIDAAKGMAKGGALITVVISATLNGIEWLFDEKYGWEDFVTNVSSDAVKATIVAAAGYLAYLSVGVATSTAVLPLAVGIAVGFAVTIGFHTLDGDMRLTNKIIEAMTKRYEYWKWVAKDPSTYIREQVNEFFYHVISEAGDIVTEVVSRALRSRLRELARRLSRNPRTRF